jgi:hypothetical protein
MHGSSNVLLDVAAPRDGQRQMPASLLRPFRSLTTVNKPAGGIVRDDRARALSRQNLAGDVSSAELPNEVGTMEIDRARNDFQHRIS